MSVSLLESVRRRPRPGLACLTASGLLWGTSGLIGTLLSRFAGFSPLAVAALRLLLGGGLIIAFLAATGAGRPAVPGCPAIPGGWPAWRRIGVNGLLSALFQGCYFAAVSLTSVSLATLVTIGAAPVIVAVAERVRDGRRLGRHGMIAFGLALVGLSLLTGPGGSSARGGIAGLAGCGLAVAAAAGFAAVTVIGTSPVPGLTDLAVNGYGFVLGGLVLTPLAAGDGGFGFRPGAAPAGLFLAAGLLLVLAVGPTSVAYTLYYRGLRTETAVTAALLTLLEPLTATVLGVVFLGDRLGAAGIAGALMLGLALVCVALVRGTIPPREPVRPAGRSRSRSARRGPSSGP